MFVIIIIAQTQINVLLKKSAKQSSLFQSYPPSYAVDGNRDGDCYHNSCSHTADLAGGPNWLVVDMEHEYLINYVDVWNRADSWCMRGPISY